MKKNPLTSEPIALGRISNNIVRVVLFRVLPGREVEVGRLLQQRCREIGLPGRDIHIFRLFGSYDLGLIQNNSKLTTSDLARLGTIPGITGSTEYVCYSWTHKTGHKFVESFHLAHLSKPLLGLCFLKINPLLTLRHGVRPEIQCMKHLAQVEPTVQVLCTLSWAEMLLLIPDSSLKSILDRIENVFPKLILADRDNRKEPFAEKTLTILGHALDISDPNAPKRRVVPIERELLKGALEVHFSASCTPGGMQGLQSYARRHFMLEDKRPRITFRLGARDLDFEVPLKNVVTLNDLLARLDKFRQDNRRDLIRTHTELQYRIETDITWPKFPTKHRQLLMLQLSAEEAAHLTSLGPEGVSVTTAIYHINNLIANRLLLDTFADLTRALCRLKERVLRLVSPLSVTLRWSLATRIQYLQQAISQRYQGAYVGVEESPWGASFGIQPAGIGVQRVLKALALIALELISRLGAEWSGFVLIGRHTRPSMEHFEDILLVTPSDALNVRRHWAITHELMHVMQYLAPNAFALRSLEGVLNEPLPSENEREGKLLIEATADIMEWRLSCTLGVTDYLRIVWGYLSEGIFESASEDQLTSYLVRSFAVFFTAKTDGGSRRLEEGAIKRLFGEFTSFVGQCGVDLSALKKLDDRDESRLDLACQEFLTHLLPYMPRINLAVTNLLKSTRRNGTMNRIEAKKAVKSLHRGDVLPEGWLSWPDVIAWEFASERQKEARPCETIAGCDRQIM